MPLIADYTCLRRELVHWKVDQKKFSRVRHRKIEQWKKYKRVGTRNDTVKWFTPHLTGILKGEIKENSEEVTCEEITAANFSKLIRSLLSI